MDLTIALLISAVVIAIILLALLILRQELKEVEVEEEEPDTGFPAFYLELYGRVNSVDDLNRLTTVYKEKAGEAQRHVRDYPTYKESGPKVPYFGYSDFEGVTLKEFMAVRGIDIP